jgi:hypothetical protein
VTLGRRLRRPDLPTTGARWCEAVLPEGSVYRFLAQERTGCSHPRCSRICSRRPGAARWPRRCWPWSQRASPTQWWSTCGSGCERRLTPCPRTPSHVVRRTASRVGPCRRDPSFARSEGHPPVRKGPTDRAGGGPAHDPLVGGMDGPSRLQGPGRGRGHLGRDRPGRPDMTGARSSATSRPMRRARRRRRPGGDLARA